MTAFSGIDLEHGNFQCVNSFRIISGLLIAFNDGKTYFTFQIGNGFFQQGGLSGTRRTDEV